MKNFVNFDLALKLKEIGFPQDITETSYFVGDEIKRLCTVGSFLYIRTDNKKHLLAAPTTYEVMEWLRNEKKIFVEISLSPDGYKHIIYTSLHFEDNNLMFDNMIRNENGFTNFEDAVIDGIINTIDILGNDGK